MNPFHMSYYFCFYIMSSIWQALFHFMNICLKYEISKLWGNPLQHNLLNWLNTSLSIYFTNHNSSKSSKNLKRKPWNLLDTDNCQQEQMTVWYLFLKRGYMKEINHFKLSNCICVHIVIWLWPTNSKETFLPRFWSSYFRITRL